jgi:SAM-dependent MidA family methyltransferase
VSLVQTPQEIPLLDILRRSGAVTFERYMALCLYHPEYGYYMRGHERTGPLGDYFTSPDLHPIFARLIARQAVEIWEMLGKTSSFAWVEMGPGRGWFARDFLEWARKQRPDFARALHYVIIEPSPEQRKRLRERIAEDSFSAETPDAMGQARNPPLVPQVRVLPSLEVLEPMVGCFFANELVDAFPVSVVRRSGGRLKELYVTVQGTTLREKLGPISDPSIAAAVARYANDLEEGQRVEVNLNAGRWMRSVAEKLTRGFVITVDYGDLAERLYTPDRSRGTLLAYRRHIPSDDLFSAPGEQDLTSHVNFSALIDAAKGAGLDFTGFTTQERFLLAVGEGNEFADLYDEAESEPERLVARLKLKRMLYPEGMGAVFKVLILHRGVIEPRLTGLRYTRKDKPPAER